MSDGEPTPRLSLKDAKLLARCLVTVLATRLALSTIGYRRLPPPALRGAPRTATPGQLGRLRGAVAWAAGYVPGATCLTQAVACRRLLAGQGIGSTLRIGVRPDPKKGLAAHAWLLCGEEIVIGGDAADLQDYSRLADFEASSR